MPIQPQSHSPQPFDGLEPEFSPDDPLERRLLADGARWRTHSAPPVEPFAQRMNAGLRERQLLADTSVEERPMSQRIVTAPPVATPQSPRRRSSRWSTFAAVAAAVAIVATLAWVFQTIPHSRVAGRSATPTPNYAAHVTHPRGHWADVAQYTTASSDDTVTVAPSDPQAAFRATRSPSDPTAVTLARTGDGGATWTPLTLPTDDGGWFGGLAISPLDAQTVFLTLASDWNNPHCPAYALPPGTDVGPIVEGAANSPHADTRLGPLHPAAGGYSCSFQYVSRDGGAHWSHPTFPWSAQHLAGLGGSLGAPVQARGTTLFAAVTGDLNGVAYAGVRLAASTDGGSTWTAADHAIAAAGQIVTSYTAIPGTTTLYAMSVPQKTQASQVSSAALWRSDDAGAHWSRLGTAPLAQATLTGAVVPGFGSIVYAAGMKMGDSSGSLAVYASRDGGHTWSQAPSAGQPQNQLGADWAPNVLADGSLLLDFFGQSQSPYPEIGTLNTNATFYAWRPGDKAWFQAAPRPGNAAVSQLWVTAKANSPQTLWIVVQAQQATIYTVRKCMLE